MLSHVSVSSNLFQKLFFYFEQTQYADHLVAFFRRRTFLPSASACLQLPRAGEADCSKPPILSLLEANQGGRGEFGRVPVYLAKSTQVTLCKQQDQQQQQQQQQAWKYHIKKYHALSVFFFSRGCFSCG